MHANALCRSELGQNIVIIELDFVVAGRTLFRVVREARAIASFRVVGRAGIRTDSARSGHDEDVSQIGVASTGKVRVGEAHDGLVLVLIASAVLIDFALIAAVHIVGNGVGFRRELSNAEWRTGSWERVPHAVRANDGVDVVDYAAKCGKTEREQAAYDEFRFHNSIHYLE